MALNLDYKPEIIVDYADLPDLEWKQYRKQGIGGSDVAAIMGASPFKTALDVYYDKTTPVVEEKLSEEEQFRFDVGHSMESALSKAFQRRTGLKVVPDTKMWRHPLYPFLLANIDDGVITPDGEAGVEYKSTNSHNADNWIGGFPYAYELQVRHYMAVKNLNRWYIMGSWDNHPGCTPIYVVERDLEIEEQIISTCQDFWENHVLGGIPPIPDGRPDQVKQALIAFHRKTLKENAGYCVADEAAAAIAEYKRLSERISRREKWIEQLKAERDNYAIPLVEILGDDYRVGYCGEMEFGYRDRRNRSCRFDDLKALSPELYNQVVTESVSTSLYIRKAKELPEELRLRESA